MAQTESFEVDVPENISDSYDVDPWPLRLRNNEYIAGFTPSVQHYGRQEASPSDRLIRSAHSANHTDYQASYRGGSVDERRELYSRGRYAASPVASEEFPPTARVRSKTDMQTWLDKLAPRTEDSVLHWDLFSRLLGENYDELFGAFRGVLPRLIEELLQFRIKEMMKERLQEQELRKEYNKEGKDLAFDWDVPSYPETLLPALVRIIDEQERKISEIRAGRNGSHQHRPTVDAGTQTKD